MPRYKGPPPLPDPATFGPGTVVDVYLRASPGRNQEKSVPEQLVDVEKFFAQRGWTIGETFADDNESGADPGRADLDRMLTKYRVRPAQPYTAGLAIWSYSRLSRADAISYEILAVTRWAGLPIISIMDPVPHEVRGFMEPVQFQVAAKWLQEIRDATRRGMRTMIAAGYAPGGFPPVGYKVEYHLYGYRRDGTPYEWPKWIVDEDKQAAVLLAWQMKLDRASLQAILERCPIGATRGTLETIFRNPCYAGFPRWYLHYHELDVADCGDRAPVVTPYVTIPQWLTVQERYQVQPRREFAGWPLSGLGFCGECYPEVVDEKHKPAILVCYPNARSRRCDVCGTRWPTATATCAECGAGYLHRAGNYRLLCDRHRGAPQRCPTSRYTGAEQLERAILEAVAPAFTAARMGEIVAAANELYAARHAGAQAQREQLQEQLAVVEEAIGGLLRACEQGAGGESLGARLQEREQEAAALRRQLAALPTPGPVPHLAPARATDLVEIFQRRFQDLSRDQRRRLFRGMGLTFQLYRDHVAGSIQWPPLNLLLSLGAGTEALPTPYVNLDCQYPQPGELVFYDGRLLFAAAA